MNSTNNYKLIIQYDGTDFAGWQYQKNAISVQQKILDGIKTITNEDVNLVGSGRTDAGVHALGQVANFRIDQELDLHKFKYSLNSILPKSISIRDIQKVHPDFHSRFDAKKRKYLYIISTEKSPFFERFSYPYFIKLDCAYLNKISKTIMGQYDFTSFCKRDSETENKYCNIHFIHWKETLGLIFFAIEADRFLHGMVRTIVGTFLSAAKNYLDESYIIDILNSKDREKAGESVPSKGLFLFKVQY
jgi:tRNA pseudouridine38-40 synthase